MPNTDIKSALEKLSENSRRITEFYDYYNGKHQLNFASDKFKNKFGRRLQKLRENLCRTVVKAPSSRLELIGFQTDLEDITKKAWDFWKKSRMPLRSNEIHREAFKTGDAFVIVWQDKSGKVRIYPQRTANIAVWYNSETEEMSRAAKAWKGTDGFYYLNLYYPDSIEKYVTKGKSSVLPMDPRYFDLRHLNGEKNPLPNPFGRVPIFHFKYDAEISDNGTSILADVIPLNDALNKSWADILGAQEENNRRRRFAAGLQVETDEETGKKINPFKPDDDVWFSDDAETKFGEFSEADLEQMLKVLEAAVKSIALVSGIPPSYFNLDSVGTAISGEALRKIEARFISLIKEAQLSFGETWAEVLAFALSIENQNMMEIEPQWTDAAPISESELLDNAIKKKALGWSEEQIQRDYGLSDEQIILMREEIAKRKAEEIERQARFFDGGNSLME